MDREQHLQYRATGDVLILDGDGSRWVREGAATCPSWAEGVPAPVDADGNVVPLTTRTLYDGDGHEISVMGYALNYSRYTGVPVWRVRKSDGMIFMLNLFHLVSPDSLEKLADDLKRYVNGNSCSYFGMADDPTCDGCPANDRGNECGSVVIEDAARRAKALAERDTKGADRG